ncbi:unnamed protein product [Moneuplotes crassus]|uniref:Uncharacterized protein n=1 Tax=Euplotes crassus TaxID=5936 RepID=A0AAD1XWX1_EUPCR|nr:unnamed protein product [Moneuplotes crassus]
MKRDYDYLFKIVIIGDSNVGKSCLLIRFADDCFTENYITTIGVDFRFRTLRVEQKNVKLQIWDTAGQERYRTITNAYYRGSDAIILVADCSNKQSFENIPEWLEEVSKYTEDDIRKILLINKADLDDDLKQVTDSDIEKMAKEHDLEILDVSAKTGKNVDESFLRVTKSLMEKRDKEEEAGTFKKVGPKGRNKLYAQKKTKQEGCC